LELAGNSRQRLCHEAGRNERLMTALPLGREKS
jgi:hypothetical protein